MKAAHSRPLPLRLAPDRHQGSEFLDVLDERVGHDHRRRERMTALILQWGHMIDEEGATPTIDRYAARWNVPVSTVYRVLGEFQQVFPTERDPGRIHELLWDGLRNTFGELLRVRVEPVPEE